MSATNLQQKPYDFQETGVYRDMIYLILQHPSMGHLCGYVLIPEGHPLHATTVIGDYDAPCVDVYGGLTWAGKLPHHEGIWLGFDCAHVDVTVPAMAADGAHLARCDVQGCGVREGRAVQPDRPAGY